MMKVRESARVFILVDLGIKCKYFLFTIYCIYTVYTISELDPDSPTLHVGRGKCRVHLLTTQLRARAACDTGASSGSRDKIVAR